MATINRAIEFLNDCVHINEPSMRALLYNKVPMLPAPLGLLGVLDILNEIFVEDGQICPEFKQGKLTCFRVQELNEFHARAPVAH